MALRHSSHAARSSGFPKPPTPPVYQRIAYTFIALTLIVVFAALWLSSVRAQVTVTAASYSTSVQVPVDIAKSPQVGQLQGRVVHGEFDKVQEFPVDNQADVTATDTVVVGTMRIVNNYSREQTLVKTTRLLTTDGRLYRIDQTITVPPKETMTVTAHSDQAGSQYVLQPGTQLSIPGLFSGVQPYIYAEVDSGFTGGSQVTNSVSAQDITNAEQTLQASVEQQAEATLAAEAGAGSDWKSVYVTKLLSKSVNVTAGTNADSFMATVKLDVTGVFFSEADMEALVRQKIQNQVPDGSAIVGFDPSTITYTVASDDPDLEKAHVVAAAQATTRLSDQSPELSPDKIAGLDVQEAHDKLMAVDGVKSVDIQLRPVWIHKLPGADHIQVVVQ